MRLVLIAVLMAVAAPARADDDTDFKSHVQAFAAETHRDVAAWGTVRLDGSKRPYRFGVVRPHAVGKAPYRLAYLIERAPDQIVIVTATDPDNGLMRVTGWDGDRFTGDELGGDWQDLPDIALRFKSMHNHGQLDLMFGVRGDALVALEINDYNREDTHVAYARRGRCVTRCPKLARFVHDPHATEVSAAHAVVDMFADLGVAGPTTWRDLREPEVAPSP